MYKACLIEGILRDGSGKQFEILPCFNKDVIHVGHSELEGVMITHTVHYCITMQLLEIQFWTIIIGKIVYRVTLL